MVLFSRGNSKDAFNVISTHRNKLVHFCHNDLNGKPLKDRHKIAMEQCLGWYHLKNLILKWDKTFPNNQGAIEHLDSLMKKHHEYLSTIFDEIKDKISSEKKKGIDFKHCPSCKFETSKVTMITTNIREDNCLVCAYSNQEIAIDCPRCEHPMIIVEEHNELHECSNCELHVSNNDVSTILDTETVSHDEQDSTINCSNCWISGGSVVIHHEYYICTDCYIIANSTDTCEWCGDMQIPGGELEDSFLTGCERCDGHLGNIKDD